jgi:acetate kinase
MKILVFNSGSSSQKSCLYEMNEQSESLGQLLAVTPPLWEAHLDWSCEAGRTILTLKTSSSQCQDVWDDDIDRDRQTQRMLETLWDGEMAVIDGPGAIDIIGHRVVHGGSRYRQSCWVDGAVKAEIHRLSEFAPLHNPANLAGIVVAEQLFPGMPQVAVFDTAFHNTLPASAFTYPGPHDWIAQGIRRYGFHGISHQYCAQRAAQLLQRDLADLKLITAHLGNGCSLAAIAGGQCIDTTMGFTPLDGLMMGSRSGSLDPGILLYLLRQGYSVEDLDRQLNHESGLLGISGISGDMRAILTAITAGEERAVLAFDLYIHRLRSLLGSMWMSLGNVDALIFTAGVGENAALVRSRVCAELTWLGIEIDEVKNQSIHADGDIATENALVRVLILRTQEDWAIARDCYDLWEKSTLE